MIEEEAIVTQLANNQAWIKRLHDGGCSGCLQQSTCGTSAVSKLLPKREFAVVNESALKVGDKVTVAVDDAQLLLSSFLLYLLPLIVMLLVSVLANALLPAFFVEYLLPVISIAGLLVTFAVIHCFQRRILIYFPVKLGKITKA